MTTARKIIERAYTKIGVRAEEAALSSSEIQDGLTELNDLLKQWDATGILKGVAPVNNVGDDLKEPHYSTRALRANLAINLAAEYGIEVSAGIAGSAIDSKNLMITASINLQETTYPSTLPKGSGNRDRYSDGFNDDFFPQQSKRNF